METQQLLQRLIDLLEKEKELLIQAIADSKKSQELYDNVQKKEELLHKIMQLPKQEVAPHKELLAKIDEISRYNQTLAQNNISFLQELFDAITANNEPSKYTSEGSIQRPKKRFFTKKV